MMPGDDPIAIPQGAESPVRHAEAGPFAYRYAYYRSTETRAAGDPGQDYLTFLQTGQSFVFALCDGVSQSFFGELAARALGNSLVQWLRNPLPDTLERSS